MPTFTGTAGDDTLDGGSGPDTIDGLAGNDTINGLGGDDTINGGDGDDDLAGGDGTDTVNGGDGNDELYSATLSPAWINPYQGQYTRPLLDTGTQQDALIGGGGFDLLFAGYGDNVDGGSDDDALFISFFGAPSGITFDARLASQIIGGGTITGIEVASWIQGSNFNDVINAQSSLASQSNYGVIEGMAGNDQLTAGSHTAIMDGGDGDDTLQAIASARMQAMFGGAGNDTIFADHTAIAYGDDGNDIMSGSYRLYGGNGNDTITVAGAQLGGWADGGANDDTITGSNNVTIWSRDDVLAGGAGADHIDGRGGRDWISSAGFTADYSAFLEDLGAEVDILWGGDGNDHISAGYGDEAIGGTGTDVLYYSLAGFGAGITFSTAGIISQFGAVVGGGSISQTEILAYLRGTDFNDELTLAFQDTVITVNAAGGDDVIRPLTRANVYGGSGSDRLIGGAILFDGGDGIDTIDYSAATFNTIVILGENGAPGTGSQGTVQSQTQLISVENAIGSVHPDTFVGNSLGNAFQGGGGNDLLTGGLGFDVLSGGAGADTFSDTAAGLSGDTILDLSPGDRIVITDATLAGFSFSMTGSTLTFNGGSITLASVPIGSLTATYAEGGGVQIGYAAATVIENDYNGDGRSDILWRHNDGTIGYWQANANATFTSVAASVSAVPAYWQIAATGDFNADGRDDILWRGANGEVGNWLANGSGGFTYNAAAGVTVIPNSWQIEGVGDFNGDDRDDILWRHSDGAVGTWTSNAAGGFTSNTNVYGVPADWQIVGVGDFNGDDRDDILWRHDSGAIGYWYGNSFANSGEFVASANLAASSNDWHVIGAGDFNGDGRDDILWRHDSGTVANWLSNANGTFTPNFASLVTISNDWNIAAIGDYDGDGRDDILWRHDSGTIANWLADASGNGTFAPNNPSLTGIGNDWQVESPDVLIF